MQPIQIHGAVRTTKSWKAKLRLPYYCASIALVVVALATPASFGQSNETGEAKVYIAFRMEKWNSRHIHDAPKAQKHAETLKQLGCEVKTASHDGHTDVSCRTIFWKSLALDSHDQAHQWEKWLQDSGFETIHAHPPANAKPVSSGPREVVQYRMTDWKSRHIHNNDELSQLLALYRGLGCDVQVSEHSGHNDVKVLCPSWMEVDMPSHEAAHAWQKFLGDMGFETKHEH